MEPNFIKERISENGVDKWCQNYSVNFCCSTCQHRSWIQHFIFVSTDGAQSQQFFKNRRSRRWSIGATSSPTGMECRSSTAAVLTRHSICVYFTRRKWRESNQNLVPEPPDQMEETGPQHGCRTRPAQVGQPFAATTTIDLNFVRPKGEKRIGSGGLCRRKRRRHQRRRRNQQRRLITARATIAFARLTDKQINYLQQHQAAAATTTTHQVVLYVQINIPCCVV